MNGNPARGGLASAESEFQMLAAADPRAALPRFQLGKLYKEKGDVTAAIRYLQRAVELMPEKPEIYFELSSALRRADRIELAEKARIRFEYLRREAEVESALMQRCATFPDN